MGAYKNIRVERDVVRTVFETARDERKEIGRFKKRCISYRDKTSTGKHLSIGKHIIQASRADSYFPAGPESRIERAVLIRSDIAVTSHKSGSSGARQINGGKDPSIRLKEGLV